MATTSQKLQGLPPALGVRAGWADLGFAASADEKKPSARLRAWRVFHAAEYVRDAFPLVEGQLAVGMKPFIVTPQGSGSGESYLHAVQHESQRPASLLRAWQDVRNWRKSLLDCDPEGAAEIVHAHSFASGMAAVRSFSAVVYDVRAFVEEIHRDEPGTWMARSFRVAEQFVLSRAAAVVVHTQAMREATRLRGAERDSLFLIPDPIDGNELELELDRAWLEALIPGGGEACLIYPADVVVTLDEHGQASASDMQLLRSFARLRNEAASARLLLCVADSAMAVMKSTVANMERPVAASIHLLPENEGRRALAVADVIVSHGSEPHAALLAMANGKALVAADNIAHRELSPDGGGLLWFKPEAERDLAYRLSFLVANADFRRSLGGAGQSFLLQTRSMAAIGQRYNEVYEHAFARRRTGSASTGFPQLQPLQACL